MSIAGGTSQSSITSTVQFDDTKTKGSLRGGAKGNLNTSI